VKKLWKRIEHWLVIIILVMTCGGWWIVQWYTGGGIPLGSGEDAPLLL